MSTSLSIRSTTRWTARRRILERVALLRVRGRKWNGACDCRAGHPSGSPGRPFQVSPGAREPRCPLNLKTRRVPLRCVLRHAANARFVPACCWKTGCLSSWIPFFSWDKHSPSSFESQISQSIIWLISIIALDWILEKKGESYNVAL